MERPVWSGPRGAPTYGSEDARTVKDQLQQPLPLKPNKTINIERSQQFKKNERTPNPPLSGPSEAYTPCGAARVNREVQPPWRGGVVR